MFRYRSSQFFTATQKFKTVELRRHPAWSISKHGPARWPGWQWNIWWPGQVSTPASRATPKEFWDGSKPVCKSINMAEVCYSNLRLNLPCWISYRISKLDTGVITQPYISTIDGIARTDSSRLLSSQDRGLSNNARRVEDPVKRKERLVNVSCDHATFLFPCLWWDYFLLPLTQRIRSRFGYTLCIAERLYT